jgi:hypothetical protein
MFHFYYYYFEREVLSTRRKKIQAMYRGICLDIMKRALKNIGAKEVDC